MLRNSREHLSHPQLGECPSQELPVGQNSKLWVLALLGSIDSEVISAHSVFNRGLYVLESLLDVSSQRAGIFIFLGGPFSIPDICQVPGTLPMPK